MTLGYVRVESNSLMSGDFSNLIEWNIANSNLKTKDLYNSWVKIEMLHHIISPNYYSLRHSRENNHFLRNWRFEGSIDGYLWICLKEHVNDHSLNGQRFATASWKIENQQNNFYKFFRIFMTGNNSHHSYHHVQLKMKIPGSNILMMNGFEIYGTIIPI